MSLPVPFPRSYWVQPHRLLAGAYPGDPDEREHLAKLSALLDCGVRTVINLQFDDEIDHDGRLFRPYTADLANLAKRYGDEVVCHRIPIRDCDIPSESTMISILDTIDLAHARGRTVYLHCWGGIGRTGTVVGCWLLRHGLADHDTVLDQIRRLRRHDLKAYRQSPETHAQRAFVRGWWEPAVRG